MNPEKKFRAGGVSATIWQNKSEKGTYATIKLSRSYLDKDKAWKETNSFKQADLPKAALVLNEAFRYLQLKDSDTQAGMPVEEQQIVA